MIKPAYVAVVLAAALSGCGSGTSSLATARIERCVDRLLEREATQSASEDEVRRYTRDTYCSPFEQNGWVSEDGALSIDAHVWLVEGASCATAGEREPATTVPCEDETRRTGSLECALLRHVRRDEVEDYLEERRLAGVSECDDGTPLEELGVPQMKG